MAFHRNALQEQLGSVTQFAVHNPRRRCVRMWLNFVCAENVQYFHPARFEVIRDKRAMATPPGCFCAHDCDRARSDGFPAVTLISTAAQAVAPCKGKKTFYGFLELLRLHVIGIAAKRRIGPRSVARVWLG